MALNKHQLALRDRFITTLGYWQPAWEDLLTMDEAFFTSYLEFSGSPYRSGSLEPVTREFIHIALDASATHLFEPGIRTHIRRALELGASSAQIMDVLEMTATVGIHTCLIAIPILLDELGDSAPKIDDASEHQSRIKEAFTSNRGYWNPFWDSMLALDPDFMESYMHFSSLPWLSNALEPKIRELCIIAFDASTTHLFVLGLRQHIRNALGYGASREEIMEVIEISSSLGIHSCQVGVPILLEELRLREDQAT